MGKQKHYVSLLGFFYIVIDVKNQKAVAFKLKVFFYRLS